MTSFEKAECIECFRVAYHVSELDYQYDSNMDLFVGVKAGKNPVELNLRWDGYKKAYKEFRLGE